MQKLIAGIVAPLLIAGQIIGPVSASAQSSATPIKHLVVIFQENVSFDHYFGTYPNALNLPKEPKFKAAPGTPSVNGYTDALLFNNPNFLNTDLNGAGASNPFRLDRSEASTADQDHNYGPEQEAFHGGLMDGFPKFTGTPGPPPTGQTTNSLVMGYFDGNTVTAFWNYAQNFAMNDNSFGTNFGPSTPGAINVASGMTGGADLATDMGAVAAGDVITTTMNGVASATVIGDSDPFYDDCSGSERIGMLSTNQNIGTLLSAKGISWGWFQGGFKPTTDFVPASGNAPAVPAACATTTNRIDGTPEAAYSAHHNPFQYYKATSNQHHLPPASLSEVGHDGQANHIYDLGWFQKSALANGLPAVSYLKANRAQDGHPSNSSPLDEQVFITTTINFLQTLPDWESTAVIIAWDDSDGWYDHVMPPIVNQSTSTADALTAPGACGNGSGSLEAQQARCGYGPRLPFLVVSPYAKKNFVDHTLTDQSSVVRFIEENCELPQIGNGSFDQIAGSIENMFDFNNQRTDKVVINPSTGQVVFSK